MVYRFRESEIDTRISIIFIIYLRKYFTVQILSLISFQN
ncbi:hypothetical protein DDD_2336 [Nonlabens dokdonensis DSW-6]|uniref:Uncharacterized protein n=1 Tax=Nonlabens dokdonensis (strain DSM 17205 / KCTC 12402 / DSW-6) TaxID=592029 RepID=L7WF02_NONDD|nr:hypothetical protein DDD_2336 [Nonlabens dokdonensis DSW-6]